MDIGTQICVIIIKESTHPVFISPTGICRSSLPQKNLALFNSRGQKDISVQAKPQILFRLLNFFLLIKNR